MPGILEGKKILVTGVLTPASIAFAIADAAQKEGADIVLTSFGRVMSLTEKSARRMKPTPEILEMDVNKQEQIDTLAQTLKQRWGRLDGFVHAIAFAPGDALGGNFMTAPWESVQTAFQTSAYSLKAMAQSLSPLMTEGGSIVTLDFDNSTQAWPFYDWMGVCKAALESVTRYLARDLGKHHIRVDALAAGPLKTMAAKPIIFTSTAQAWPSSFKQPNSSIEQLSIANRSLLDRFAPARRQLALGQSLQSVSVDQNQTRLMKSSDNILSRSGVDAGLAANRSIDLRK